MNADLLGADLTGADFTEADLICAKLDGARWCPVRSNPG